MSEIQDKIRKEAKKILASGEVAVVIGWKAGSVPFKTTPVFIEKAEDADKLVWNPGCVNNLAVYLPKLAKDKKVGVVAKPCDVRTIVNLVKEKQIARENVYIIGLGCDAVVDAGRLDGHGFDLADVTLIEWQDGGLQVTTESGASAVARGDVIREQCSVCTQRTPVMSDVTLGEPSALTDVVISGLPELPEERQRYWSEQFAKCIRCYACRQVCPNCYCSMCFADRVDQKWTAKKVTADEAWMFHSVRAMHLAGRCISCGECSRSCPVGIPVAELMSEMSKRVNELYDYEAGNPDETAEALGQFREADIDPAHHSE